MNRNVKAAQQTAIDAVHQCAEVIEARTAALLGAAAGWTVDDGLRAILRALCTTATDTARRVQFELALLRQQISDGQATDAGIAQLLTQLEAPIMSDLTGFADLVDRLEAAAETDERCEPAFEGSIEALGTMMQAFQRAKTATEALPAADPGR